MIRNILMVTLLMTGVSTGSVKAQAPATSLLWKISGNGLQMPSYLFGTFHMMCKSEFRISDTLSELIGQSGQFFGELKMDDPSMQQKIAAQLMLKDQTLEGLLGKEVFAGLNEKYQQITGMPLILLNQYKPFMSASLLALSTITCLDKIQPETAFSSIAQKKGIPILGLETIEDQIRAVDKQPLDSQLQSLIKSIRNFDSVRTMMGNMQEVYRLRDADSLYRFVMQADMGGDFETEMLVNRNLTWIPKIKRAMEEKNSFFAVGAGHLGGPNGVLALLRKQGYTLTPIKY